MAGSMHGVQLLWHDHVHVVLAPCIGGAGAAAASLHDLGEGHLAGVEAGQGHCLEEGCESQLAYRAGILAGGLQHLLEL